MSKRPVLFTFSEQLDPQPNWESGKMTVSNINDWLQKSDRIEFGVHKCDVGNIDPDEYGIYWVRVVKTENGFDLDLSNHDHGIITTETSDLKVLAKMVIALFKMMYEIESIEDYMNIYFPHERVSWNINKHPWSYEAGAFIE